MLYTILESHIKFNKATKDHTITVAILSSKGYYKAYTSEHTEISEKALQHVAAKGNKLREPIAKEVFPILSRSFKYEG